MKARHQTAVATIVALSLPWAGAIAANDDWQIGVRTGILLSDGTPANDMTHWGVSGKYKLGNGAYIGVSIDQLGFDFERPWQVLGLQQDRTVKPTDIDAKARSTLFRVYYEREYGKPQESWSPFWNAGLGIASVKVDNVSGPVVGGGTFTISTDGGTEIVPSLGGGVRYNFTPGFSADLGFSLNYHLADWEVRDSVSGRTATVKSYVSYGPYLGASFRF